MYKIGQKVIDKLTDEPCVVMHTYETFCLIMYKNGLTTGRFFDELEEYNFIKGLLRKVGFKNGRKQNK